MVFTANGRQCIAAALAAAVPSGGRCGIEALTYPLLIKNIAARLGVTLVPLAMDENGVRADAVQKRIAKRIYRRCTFSPSFRIRWASRCRR